MSDPNRPSDDDPTGQPSTRDRERGGQAPGEPTSWSPDAPVPAEEFDRALRFVNTMAMSVAHRTAQVESLLLAMVEALAQTGELDPQALEAALEQPPPDDGTQG